ncbi:hypothetical protein EJ04DRAFT_558666 [Polyplosphaeria fusca]|uniref:Uncharacterized protein n=1 Tax=Polyplosphaeria fusca TaxID=682080 RepID=A0A9P4RC30_9PLEO|nr:hypothetical protein EJ04DRAFT_558666 [Polyplosphaeria fusca]
MSRTLELGRAVLDSTNAGLQLWFTTLITVSTEQLSNDTAQHSQSDILDLLLSEDILVDRGHGMNMVLDIAIQGEPIHAIDRKQLLQKILNAPAWEQLHLRPSLDEPSTGSVQADETIKINISRCPMDVNPSSTGRHRLFTNVPLVATYPAGGTPVVHLQSIHYTMNIFKLGLLNEGSRRKRAKHSGSSKSSSPSRKTELTGQSSRDQHSAVLFDVASTALNNITGDNSHVSGTGVRNESKKRRRSASKTVSALSVDYATSTTRIQSIGALVDGALRLSIDSAIPRSLVGMKSAASTFRAGLSRLSPILWSPRLLSNLSSRSHLMPIISCSLSQAAISKARSNSLKVKTSQLSAFSTNSGHFASRLETSTRKNVEDAIHAQLWGFALKAFTTKAPQALKSFFSSTDEAPEVDTDDILVGSDALLEEGGHELPFEDVSIGDGCSDLLPWN